LKVYVFNVYCVCKLICQLTLVSTIWDLAWQLESLVSIIESINDLTNPVESDGWIILTSFICTWQISGTRLLLELCSSHSN
jgi:hypothetical protein